MGQRTRVQTSPGDGSWADSVPWNTEMISNFKQSSEVLSHLELASVSNLVAMSEEVAWREGGVSGSRAPRDFVQL